MRYGELPKRLKGAVSKTARRESVRGFKSLILRHQSKNALIQGIFSLLCPYREKIVRRLIQKMHHLFIPFLEKMCVVFQSHIYITMPEPSGYRDYVDAIIDKNSCMRMPKIMNSDFLYPTLHNCLIEVLLNSCFSERLCIS